MAYERILVDKDGDGIVTITLNRPERLNASSTIMGGELRQALRETAADASARVVVLTGAGRAFCSGQDLKDSPNSVAMLADRFMPRTAEERDAVVLRNMPQPVIACVNGVAAGYGLALAVACDLRIASDRASFAAMWLPRGIPPEAMSMFTLPQIIGISKAFEIVLMGKTVNAEEALRIGLVNEVAPHEQLAARTREIALAIANGPPVAIAMAKRTMYLGLGADMDRLAQYESWALRHAFQTEDRLEGIRSFKEKRPPKFKGK